MFARVVCRPLFVLNMTLAGGRFLYTAPLKQQGDKVNDTLSETRKVPEDQLEIGTTVIGRKQTRLQLLPC